MSSVSNTTFAAGVHVLEDVCKSLSQLPQTPLCIRSKKTGPAKAISCFADSEGEDTPY